MQRLKSDLRDRDTQLAEMEERLLAADGGSLFDLFRDNPQSIADIIFDNLCNDGKSGKAIAIFQQLGERIDNRADQVKKKRTLKGKNAG